MKVSHDGLRRLVTRIFATAGCGDDEAARVSDSLVESNLVGHDSHGVIRVASYVVWLGEGKVVAGRDLEVVIDSETFCIVDGQNGFGQVMAARAMRLAIARASRHGVGVVGLRNSAHIGRVGEWAEQAVGEGMIAICFVNTSGLGILTAPHGGIDRRLSANPFAVGIPVEGATPVILDFSASSIAEGKIRVALHRGDQVPENCIIDREGRPITDPQTFYDDPGAILPFGGHKGYGLGLVTEILAGALTGGGCSKPGELQLNQSMLAIVIDPARLAGEIEAFSGDIRRYFEFVRSSRTVTPDGEILMPGEPEQRTRARRMADGIELDATTWEHLLETCENLSIPQAEVNALVGN